MALFGSLATVRSQAPSSRAFAAAWLYIDALLQPGSSIERRVAALQAGEVHRNELAEGVVAIEQAYTTKPRAEGFFESHRRFIDIQVIVTGTEIMEVVDVAHAKVRESYNEERDLIIYLDAQGASSLTMPAGHAAIFFPVDVHMPTLIAGEPTLVRKVVLKVPVNG